MAKKLVLDFEVQADFEMIGIVSPIRDYRLMFFLNKALRANFVREEPFSFQGKKEVSEHTLYNWYDQEHYVGHFLIANHANRHILIPEYRQIDYVLVLDGEPDFSYIQTMLKSIKSVGHIRMATQLQTDRMRSYDDLALQLEMNLSHT